MKACKAICLGVLCAGAFSAYAANLQDMTGRWRELGWRCEGTAAIHVRESQSEKLVSIHADGTYEHRVNLNDRGSCRFISSEGDLMVQADRGDRLTVVPVPRAQTDCAAGSSTLVDDFALDNGAFDIRIEHEMLRDVLVLSGDPSYTSSNCRNPAVERIYVRVH